MLIQLVSTINFSRSETVTMTPTPIEYRDHFSPFWSFIPVFGVLLILLFACTIIVSFIFQ